MEDPNTVIENQFPKLRGTGYKITSEDDPGYNCIAFAAGDYRRWWAIPFGSPKHYWPPGINNDETVDDWVRAFKMLNYEITESDKPEPGFDRIAIYAVSADDAAHVAVQLDGDGWKSKLGEWNDISHPTLDLLTCPEEAHMHDDNCYGSVYRIMKRKSHKAIQAERQQSPL